MTARLLNTVGLLLGMVGVVILFIWGPPQPDLDEGFAIGLSYTEDTVFEDGTKPAEHDAKVRKRKRLHQIMSRIGLGLVGVGFFAQLVALWTP